MLNFVATTFAGRQRAIDLRAKLPLLDDKSATAWIEAAYVGVWKGHHNGEFEFTLDTFNNILSRFDAQQNPVPVTYEHPQYRGDGQPIPAAGWVIDLKIEGEALMALVEFTPRAAQMIRDGEYKFSSVVVDLESQDRASGEEVGPELYEIGLTNVPFLDGQKPIELSRRPSAEREAMGLFGRNKKEKVQMSDTTVQNAEPPVAAAEDMPPEEVGAEAAAALTTVQMIAEAAGLDVAAVLSALEENMEAVVSMLSGAPEDGTPSDEQAATQDVAASQSAEASVELSRLREENEKLAGVVAELQADAMPGDKEKLVSLARKLGPDGFREACAAFSGTVAASAPPRGRVYAASAKPPVEDGESASMDQLDAKHTRVAEGLIKNGMERDEAIRRCLSRQQQGAN